MKSNFWSRVDYWQREGYNLDDAIAITEDENADARFEEQRDEEFE